MHDAAADFAVLRRRQWQDSAGVRAGQNDRQHGLHHCAHRRPDGRQEHAGRLRVHSSAWRVCVAAWTSHAGVIYPPFQLAMCCLIVVDWLVYLSEFPVLQLNAFSWGCAIQ